MNWRFPLEQDALWVKIIRSIHGLSQNGLEKIGEQNVFKRARGNVCLRTVIHLENT